MDALVQGLKIVKDNLQRELEKLHKNTSLKGPLVGAKHLSRDQILVIVERNWKQFSITQEELDL